MNNKEKAFRELMVAVIVICMLIGILVFILLAPEYKIRPRGTIAAERNESTTQEKTLWQLKDINRKLNK